ncbi:hypothetical protein V6N11_004679 [Hibiscus sabdariffa]|uniref:Uncharacterized protein n=1 Tax=Hibiscus sabdariffa TaxID=183260 RepID=A0ABR2SH20_9ROSI
MTVIQSRKTTNMEGSNATADGVACWSFEGGTVETPCSGLMRPLRSLFRETVLKTPPVTKGSLIDSSEQSIPQSYLVRLYVWRIDI